MGLLPEMWKEDTVPITWIPIQEVQVVRREAALSSIWPVDVAHEAIVSSLFDNTHCLEISDLGMPVRKVVSGDVETRAS